MTDTTLWLIRHGETAWNTERRFQGHTDIPLNGTGLNQARLLAERLANEHRSHPFAAIYSSDLARARDTAQAAATRMGLTVREETGLRERDYGVLSTLTPEEMAALHPHAFDYWQRRDPDYVLPGGESLVQFAERVALTVQAIAQRHAGDRIVIVAHGGVLDCAYRAATGMSLSAKREHTLRNASINRLRQSGAGWAVERWGDVAHLDVEAFDEL